MFEYKKLRLTVWLLAFIALVSCASDKMASKNTVSDQAEQEESFPEGLLYEVIDDRSIRITKYIGYETSINIPTTIDGLPVTVIGSVAFAGCDELTGVTIPPSVITIGEYAFSRCRKLTSITIPSSVTTIGDPAFEDPAFGISVFDDCDSLTNISVDRRNSSYTSVGGVLFSKDGKTLIRYPAGKNGAYTIPRSVITIGGNAFSKCENLTSVTIPYSVITIGVGAFSHCRKLTSITIPDSVTTIKAYAFYNCKLTDITIPSSVTIIEEGAFKLCYSWYLESVTLSRNTQLGEDVFEEGVRIEYRD